jgi:hypothetical protein
MMKKLLLVVLSFLLTSTQTGFAVTKPVTVKEISLLSNAPGAEGVLAVGAQVVTFSNLMNSTTDVSVISRDLSGASLWSKTIDSGRDEIASAITSDSKGGIWLAGMSAAAASPTDSSTPGSVSNPDGVTTTKISPTRGDLTEINLWQISASGELVATYSSSLGAAGLINAISVSNNGISVVGSRSNSSFLVASSLSGVFSKVISLGTSKSVFNSVTRSADGGHYLVGSSSEILGGKKPAGVKDGVLVKLSKTGAITSVVRSSASGATRSWNCSTSNLLTVGDVKTSKGSEVAITKFSSTFSPTWTMRIPSSGSNACSIGAAGTFYSAITQSVAIKGISGLKTQKGQGLIIGIDSKGVIASAMTNVAMGQPIALSYSPGNGVALLSSGVGANPASIFYLKTR